MVPAPRDCVLGSVTRSAANGRVVGWYLSYAQLRLAV